MEIKPILVTGPPQFEAVLDELRQAERFAFDTEFVMEESYAAEICLIQVATESMVALIDPIAKVDDSKFWDLVADPQIEKIVHSGAEDLSLCVQRTGRIPRNVFDLQIAAGLVGLDYPMSLLKLVRAVCRARLHKSQTLTDWRRRPLTDAQIQYAIDDVAFLPAAHRAIVHKLQRKRRVRWAKEEFKHFEQPGRYQRSDEAKVFRLKGVGALGEQGLAIARELLKAREAMGRQFNRPARVLVKDHLLVEIARHQWTVPKQIRGLRGLQISNAGVKQLAEAVERGMATSPDTWPVLPKSEVDTPRESALISLGIAVVRAYCHEHGIAH
ncbi:MAG: ribonuclease D, partial [Phycisphaerae bacterium]|nr:ribonuclease D [Phycisphaerae bacterium]